MKPGHPHEITRLLGTHSSTLAIERGEIRNWESTDYNKATGSCCSGGAQKFDNAGLSTHCTASNACYQEEKSPEQISGWIRYVSEFLPQSGIDLLTFLLRQTDPGKASTGTYRVHASPRNRMEHTAVKRSSPQPVLYQAETSSRRVPYWSERMGIPYHNRQRSSSCSRLFSRAQIAVRPSGQRGVDGCRRGGRPLVIRFQSLGLPLLTLTSDNGRKNSLIMRRLLVLITYASFLPILKQPGTVGSPKRQRG